MQLTPSPCQWRLQCRPSLPFCPCTYKQVSLHYMYARYMLAMLVAAFVGTRFFFISYFLRRVVSSRADVHASVQDLISDMDAVSVECVKVVSADKLDLAIGTEEDAPLTWPGFTSDDWVFHNGGTSGLDNMPVDRYTCQTLLQVCPCPMIPNIRPSPASNRLVVNYATVGCKFGHCYH
jgi:hypothetical protein